MPRRYNSRSSGRRTRRSRGPRSTLLAPVDRDYIEWTSQNSGTGSFTFPQRYRGRQIKLAQLELSLIAVDKNAMVECTYFGSNEPFSTKDILVSSSVPRKVLLRPRRSADYITLPADVDATAFVLNTNEKIMVVAIGMTFLRPLRNNPDEFRASYTVSSMKTDETTYAPS